MDGWMAGWRTDRMSACTVACTVHSGVDKLSMSGDLLRNIYVFFPASAHPCIGRPHPGPHMPSSHTTDRHTHRPCTIPSPTMATIAGFDQLSTRRAKLQ